MSTQPNFSLAVSRYTVVMPDPCWIWRGTVSGGYGTVWDGQRVQWAHRLAWESVNGSIPDEMTVDHFECRNTLCVNPQHLELVTRAENTARGNRNRIGLVCINGHVLEGDNVAHTAKGRRYCRACKTEANQRSAKKRTARRRAAAKEQS